MRRFSQVFSTVRARLSQSLLEAIPGSKSAYLHSSTSGCQVALRQEDDTFELSGSLSSVVEAHGKLQSLFGFGSEETRRETEDKGVHCCLLKPRYSRSGREVGMLLVRTFISELQQYNSMNVFTGLCHS